MSAMLELREGLQHCPAHEDRRPSLSVRRGADGRWLLHDFGGCHIETILNAAGLTWAHLYPNTAGRPTQPPRVRHWRDVAEAPLIARERRVERKLEPWVPVYRISDFIRNERQLITVGRALASIVGAADHVWDILDRIAARERVVSVIEAELDAALEHY
jgi:hypothetical protein